MTAETEVALRAAVEALVAELVAAVRAEAAQAQAAPDRLLNIGQAAEALGIGRSALYGELAAGRLRSVKVGRRRLIPASAIRAFIEAGHGRP